MKRLSKICSLLTAAALLLGVAPAMAYTDENNTKTWTFEKRKAVDGTYVVDDIAFKWSDFYSSSKTKTVGPTTTTINGSSKNLDEVELKNVVGAWQRIVPQTYSAVRYDPTAVAHTLVTQSTVTNKYYGDYENVAELTQPDGVNLGEQCVRLRTKFAGTVPVLAMKLNLTDRDVIPGRVYKLTFYAATNKTAPAKRSDGTYYTGDNALSDEDSSTITTTDATYAAMRVYAGFKSPSTVLTESGTSAKTQNWLSQGSWTNVSGTPTYGTLHSAKMGDKGAWKQYTLYIKPDAADFKNGLISLWLGAGSEYSSEETCYPFLDDTFNAVYFDNISLSPLDAEASVTTATVKQGQRWLFEDNENAEITAQGAAYEYGKWTIAGEYDKKVYATTDFAIPHYVKTKDVLQYNARYNPTSSSSWSTSYWAYHPAGPQPAAAAGSTQCIEMRQMMGTEEKYKDKYDKVAVLGAKVKLSNKQLEVGKTYNLTFYGRVNYNVRSVHCLLTSADVYYALRVGDNGGLSSKEAWGVYDNTGDSFAGYANHGWQRFSINITPTADDFNSNGDTILYILGLRYNTDGSNTDSTEEEYQRYGEAMYLDDISLTPVEETAYAAGNTARFFSDVVNYQGNADTRILAAMYDGEKLVKCSIADADEASVLESTGFEMYVPQDTASPRVKLFVWNADTLKPLTMPADVGAAQ